MNRRITTSILTLALGALLACGTASADIMFIEVTSPAKGDVWNPGSTYAIQWTPYDTANKPNPYERVNITLFPEGSPNQATLITDIATNSDLTVSLNWKVPPDTPPGTYVIRVQMQDTVKYPNKFGDSSPFTIGPPASSAGVLEKAPTSSRTKRVLGGGGRQSPRVVLPGDPGWVPPTGLPPITGEVSGQEIESDTDRPGMDFKSFDLPTPDLKLCETACKENPEKCKAWTYVKPGTQGPNARCWLKSAVPPAIKSNCCISGVMKSASESVKEARPAQGSIEPYLTAEKAKSVYQPDLIVKDMALIAGCRLQFTIQNVGAIGVTQNIKVAYGPPDNPNSNSADFPPGSLKNQGGEEAYVFPWATFPVPTPIRLEVNPDKSLAESDHTNNAVTKTMQCLPDLVIKDLDVTQNCGLQFTIKNVGIAHLPQWFRVYFSDSSSSKPIFTDLLADLAPGAEKTYAVPAWAIGTNPVPVTLTVGPIPNSPAQGFSETDSTNNSLTETLQCGP